ncbi:MAG: hypothetical protein C4575_13995 [Desulforudis sp.]|jgi:hypothetical protein|nr:MAG: hypothetical protein C4575_13995 [Desulforudis sp.]
MLNILFTQELTAVLIIICALAVIGGLYRIQNRFPANEVPKPGRQELPDKGSSHAPGISDGKRPESDPVLACARLIAAGIERDVNPIRTIESYEKWSAAHFWR